MKLKISSKTIFKIFKGFALISLLSVLVISGFVYVSVSELKLKLERIKLSKSSVIQTESVLESGAFARRADLESYLKFSETSRGKPEFTGSPVVEIPEDIKLPNIRLNSCERLNCLQFRERFESVPAGIWKALLGTEDFRFLEHSGVDYKAIARAIVADIIAMRFVQGGSTLTQQLVKNLFLTSERKLSRKIKEVIYAFYIENILEKDEIISLYLNEVFWGTHQGVYLKGFYAASLAYFNKEPLMLDEFESVILISLLKGPNYYSPKRGIKRIEGRASAVLARLKGLGIISKYVTKWDQARWLSWQKSLIKRGNQKDFYNIYLVSKNREPLLEGFEKFTMYQGITRVKKILKKRVGEADIGIKVLVMDKSCKSFDCDKSFSYYSKFEREKVKALREEKHQVGSLLKPIVYETFIDFGYKYTDEVSTAPIVLNLKSGKWAPKDYLLAKRAKIPLRVALQKSKNIPLVRLASEIGFDELEKKLELSIPLAQKPLSEYPAQLLGALELSLEEVALIYKKFIEKKCREISSGEKKYEESVLAFMSKANETTISKIAYGQVRETHIFGKTGTSNGGLDNWYFAFDGQEYYLIWFGVESNRGERDMKLSGGASSFRIFQEFINSRGKQVSEVFCH